jgi:hypothetical protein
MIRNFYGLQFVAIFLIATASNAFSVEPRNGVNEIKNTEPLSTPILTLYDARQTDISYYVTAEDGSTTEIYRSTDHDSGFILAGTVEGNDVIFFDSNLKPRTQYYYKARSIKDGITTPYSNIESISTESNFYNPILTATALDGNTVQLKLTDRSYQDLSYEILSGDSFYEPVILSDSGQTATVISGDLEPGTTYTYTVNVSLDEEGGTFLTNVATATVTTPQSAQCEGTGSIQREKWTGLPGTSFADVPFNSAPNSVTTLTLFEGPTSDGNDYASRVRGYVCPPSTGDYIFWIASDDKSELWLSTDDNPLNKVKIASVTGYTNLRQWTKYATQQSATKRLIAGQRYYIEAIHKEGAGADHLSVGWQLPNGTQERPIPGNRLIKYNPEVITSCTGTGKIKWEVWNNISGTDISSIPVNSQPNYTTNLTNFETPQYFANNYASRVRGHICVPVSGNYIFWISSDDKSELWLSTDENPAHKVKIAYLIDATPYHNWGKYNTQKSAPINLQAGHKYYIEALHKEGGGNDFVSVGWQLPNGVLERPIPGSRLIPFGDPSATPPTVEITNPSPSDIFTTPANISITAYPTKYDGTISKVEFYNGDAKLGEDLSSPYSYQWNNVPAGTYVIKAKAIDNFGLSGTDEVTITVNQPCAGTGSIRRDVWFGVSGTSVSDIPVNTTPSIVYDISSFETPQYYENNYGSRLRGFLCVPTTGNYTFYISSDDNSELWLSTDENNFNKVKIASVTGNSSFRNFTKYPSQTSASIPLVAGHRYYIEALHKEANGNDHITVGWRLPNGSQEIPIPGSRLSPGSTISAASISEEQVVITEPESGSEEAFSVYPNPVTGQEVRLSLNGNLVKESNQIKVEVSSSRGEVIHSEVVTCSGCSEIPIAFGNSVSPGVYIVNVNVNGKRLHKKLLVQ